MAARANSRPVAAAVGRNQLARMLDGWVRANGTLQARLTDRLRELVRSGALPAGTRLPSERTVADALNVSRNTVGAAFDQLRSEGLFSSRRGDGTYVSLAGLHTLARGDDRLLSFVTAGSRPHDPIDLRSAALPGLSMVADEIERLGAIDIQELVATHGYVPGGIAELREAVAGYYRNLGLPTEADQILITSGAQQALRLVTRTLLEPGATVLIEEPSYRGAIEVLRGAGAHLIPVPSGGRGVDVGELRHAIARHRPGLVLIQSTVHNPTGSVLDSAARRAVADMGVPVLDDASPADVLIDGSLPTPVAAFGGEVITVGSASKAFWGGLRVGWVRADRGFVQSLASVKGGEDLGTSVVAQVVTARLLRQIDVARAERATVLRAVRDQLLDAIAATLPDWEPLVPAGGASCWVRLPAARATAFVQTAERAGVSVLPGPTFSCADGLDDHLRIGFAATAADVVRGVERLAAAWRQFD